MKKILKGKLLIWLTAGLSLLAVFVCAVATLTWFEIDTQPLTTDFVTSSPNLDVQNDDIYSYKISHEVDPSTGFVNYNSTSIQATKGSSMSVENGHQSGEDADFNVPSSGIGYYLVKRNSDDGYTFTFYGNSMSWKLEKISGTTRYYNGSVILAANDKLMVKNYDFDNHETVITTRALNTCSSGGTLTTNVVTVTSAGTYKVWLTNSSGSWDLALESTSYNPGSFNRSVKPQERTPYTGPKRGTTTASHMIIWLIDKCSFTGNNNDPYVHFTVTEYADNFVYDNYSDIASNISGYSLGSDGESLDVQMTWVQNDYGCDGGSYRAYKWEAPWYFKKINAYFCNGDKTWYANSTVCQAGTDYRIKVSNGGYGNNANVATDYSTTASNISVTTYTLTYNTNGGSSISASTLKQYQKTVKPTNPTKSGYTFSKWTKTNSVSGTEFTFGGHITANTTIYAQWTENVSTSTYTYYLYLNGQNSWSTVYCYGFGTDKYPNATSGNGVACTSGNVTVGGQTFKRYIATISQDYTKILFNCNSMGSNNVQTIDITAGSTKHQKYYVLTGTTTDSGITKYTGSWYASISGISSTLKDYYIYDQAEYLQSNSGTPKVYTWKNNVAGDGTNTFYIPHNAANAVENAAWPGTALLTTDADGTTPLPAHMYRFRVSEAYDSFVLNNGKGRGASGAFQTQDLTGANGLANHGMASGAARTSSTYYFVFSGATQNGEYYNVNGTWVQNIGTISLKVAFAIYDGTSYTHLSTLNYDSHSGGYDTIKNDYYVSTVPYKPTITLKSQINGGNNYIIGDNTNGILYHFEVPSTLVWYKDTNWSATFNKTDGETGYVGDLYIRAVCDIRDFKTFYIDASVWGATSLAIKNTGATETWMTISSTVAPKLFRITLPNDTWNFQVNYSTYAINGAVMMENESPTSYLTLDNASSTSGHTWRSLEATSIGTAVIQAYENSAWVTKAEMSVGDIEHYGQSSFSNFFIYEHGLRLAVGTKVRVVYTQGGSYSSYGLSSKTYANVSDYVGGTTPKYLNPSGALTTATYTGTARFNFYITGEQTISIAMVPDYGNGFYIMKYNSTYGLNNFINGTKMNSSNSTSAIYNGYYIAESTQLFIRSYLDAVDTLYTTWDNTSIASASMNASGIITISSAGYYNISVNDGTVKVAAYTGIADAFKLNPLDTNNVATRAAIKAQKTSLFIEIPFYCNNTYETTITLAVSNPSYEFVGVGLYVTGTKLTTSNIYNTLTANAVYNNLTKFANSSSTEINNLNTSFTNIPVNQAGLYYAYIVIDYLPTAVSGVSYTNFNSAALLDSRMGYYLVGRQA